LKPTTFLSEFERGPLARLLTRKYWFIWLSLINWLVLACVLLAGDRAGANALMLTVSATVDGQLVSIVPIVFGYLNELPHTFLYLLLAPAVFYIGYRFLCAAGDSLVELKDRNVLTGTLLVEELLVPARGRRAWRWALPLFSILLVSWNAWIEGNSYLDMVHHPSAHDLGYVQAGFLSRWKSDFALLSPSNKLQWIQSLKSSDPLEQGIRSRLQDDQSLREQLAPVLTTQLGDKPSTPSERTGGMSALRFNFKEAVETGLISLTTTTAGGHSNWPWWQLIFVVLVVVLEGCFQAFALWLLIKTGWWLYVLFRLFGENGYRGCSLQPIFDDRQKRYGILELDPAYNALTNLVFIGSLIVSLSYFSNSEKATYVWSGHTLLHAYIGQLCIMILVAALATVIIFGPLFLFGRQVQGKIKKKRKELNQLESRAEESQKSAINDERAVLNEQKMWPINKWKFSGIVLGSLIFFSIPFADSIGVMPEEYTKSVNWIHFLQKTMSVVSSSIYDIPPASSDR